MSLTPRQKTAGIRRFNVNLLVATLDFYQQLSASEGVSMQSLIAMDLNKAARERQASTKAR